MESDSGSPPPVPDSGAPPDVAGNPDHDAPPAGNIREQCFPFLDPSRPLPDYDKYAPVVGSHCMGTNHQEITGIQKVVFLGDSITKGTPPTIPTQFYTAVLKNKLEDRFGPLDSADCSAWGARTDDLLMPPHQQILECFPAPEPKKTLIVMTVGGNDMHGAAQDAWNDTPMDEILGTIDGEVALLSESIAWLKDPANFPNGSYIVFANVYEYTDMELDLLGACPGAITDGAEDWPEGRLAWSHINEEYMRLAVETQTDMVFLWEGFCGHGFHAGESDNECFRGEGADEWFDLTCIHPNPAGHAALADMFDAVIGE